MHDALSLLSGTRMARFGGVRSRLPFVSTSDDDADPAATDEEQATTDDLTASPAKADESATESAGRLAAVRERLPLVPAPDDGTPATAAETTARGRLAGVRERLPLVPSAEPTGGVVDSDETTPDWRDAMVDPIEESSLLTPNRMLAIGGSLVGVGGLLSVYALLKRRAERAVTEEEQTRRVAGTDGDSPDRGGVVGLAFLLGWSALVRRLRREADETTG
jgi:hypothetical protein